MRASGWAIGAVLAVITVIPAWADPYDVAVIVGNRNYSSANTPAVDYAHNDADAFKKFALDVLGVRPGNLIDLRDATLNQLNAVFGNAVTAEGKLFNYVRPGASEVFVYYSGHGVPGPIGRATGGGEADGYLLPSDGEPSQPQITGYSIALLQSNLEKLPARSVTLVMDACFSGASNKGALVTGISGNFGIAVELPKTKVTRLTAASARQVAIWDDTAKHGMFTEYVLRALYGEADADKDGRVTLGETKAYLDRELTYCARRTRGLPQTATVEGNQGTVIATTIGISNEKPIIRGVCDVDEIERVIESQTNLQLSHYKECANCPEMVGIPRMSSRHALQSVGVHEVSMTEWKACVNTRRCRPTRASDESKADSHLPVANIDLNDALVYVDWLSALTGHRYRLLTPDEWDYFAFGERGDSNPWPWTGGVTEACKYENLADFSFRAQAGFHPDFEIMPCSDNYGGVAPVGSFRANRFGLKDMLGNVAEITARCDRQGSCQGIAVKGGTWFHDPYRILTGPAILLMELPSPYVGIRVGRE